MFINSPLILAPPSVAGKSLSLSLSFFVFHSLSLFSISLFLSLSFSLSFSLLYIYISFSLHLSFFLYLPLLSLPLSLTLYKSFSCINVIETLGVGKVFYKLDSLQPSGSFKIRGVSVLIQKALESSKNLAHVVSSSGVHLYSLFLL
jgi:hypothetical protein